MLDFIGYPDWIKNKTALDAYYNEYDGVCCFTVCHWKKRKHIAITKFCDN